MGNKNNYGSANFVQVGCHHNGCSSDCDNQNDVMVVTTGCECDHDAIYNGCGNIQDRECECDQEHTGANAYGCRGS